MSNDSNREPKHLSNVGDCASSYDFLAPPCAGNSVKTAEGTAAGVAHKPRILVVEDDEIVRRVIVQTLQRLGYIVMVAESGKTALSCWTEAQGAIDVFLADIFLPDGTTGTELAHEFWKANPRLKVIFTSGYPYDSMGDNTLFHKGSFLQKPYSADQLAQVVTHCLNEPKRS